MMRRSLFPTFMFGLAFTRAGELGLAHTSQSRLAPAISRVRERATDRKVNSFGPAAEEYAVSGARPNSTISQQRNALGIRRRRDRLEKGVDVGQLLIRHLNSERRHGEFGSANILRKSLKWNGILG